MVLRFTLTNNRKIPPMIPSRRQLILRAKMLENEKNIEKHNKENTFPRNLQK